MMFNDLTILHFWTSANFLTTHHSQQAIDKPKLQVSRKLAPKWQTVGKTNMRTLENQNQPLENEVWAVAHLMKLVNTLCRASVVPHMLSLVIFLSCSIDGLLLFYLVYIL